MLNDLISLIQKLFLGLLSTFIKTIILPDHNRKDLEDIPEQIKKDLEFHFAKEMMDVIDVAIPELKGKKKTRNTSSKVKKAI